MTAERRPLDPRVVAVVVAYQRRELLAEALAAVLAQTRPPAAVVVVDNASSDGTSDMVRERFPSVDLLRLERNLGGAGGFALGIERALSGHAADLVWVMDDDTVPEPAALAALVQAWAGHPGGRPAAVASRVVWHDGREHPMNTPRRRPGAGAAEVAAAGAVGCVPVRSASFVSLLVDAEAVRAEGLPEADYFIWNDDFEFTTRLLRRRPGLHCPASVVVHKTRTFGATDADPGERFYFEVRNKVWLFSRSHGLSPAEKLLYGGASVRRWARTFARSADRRTLLRGLSRGLVAGVVSAPRPTAEVLAPVHPLPPVPGAGRSAP